MRPGEPAPPAAAVETPAAAAYKRDQLLLRALHKGLEVERAGKRAYIHTIRAQRAGGGVATDVYLVGDATAHDSSSITLADVPT